MLRLPEHRRALAQAKSESILELFEDYELAWDALTYWPNLQSKNESQLQEYRDLIASLEAEVLKLVARQRK